jgi:mycofactocin precursor
MRDEGHKTAEVRDPGSPVSEGAVATAPPPRRTDEERDLVVDELLVEDVSIDGMCGVY